MMEVRQPCMLQEKRGGIISWKARQMILRLITYGAFERIGLRR